jgi:hypothetical protein
MRPRDDVTRRPVYRRLAVGLLLAASTFVADLAAFTGSPGVPRVMLFAAAGLLTAGVVVASTPKKSPQGKKQLTSW